MIRLLLAMAALLLVVMTLLRPGAPVGDDGEATPLYERELDAAHDVERQMQRSLEERMRAVPESFD